jgi:serine/threonine-protein kinase
MRPAAPPPPPERPAPRRSAWPWVLVLLLLALAAVAGFVVYTMLSGNDKTVPDTVIGQSCKQAQATLRADGLKGRCVTARSSVADIHKVVATDPSVGSSVAKGSTVLLKVGIGPKAITVPHLKGLSTTQANTLLTSKGFTVNPQNINVNSPAAALGFVIGSIPKEGTAQKVGTEVTLKVATGSVQIANISGKSCAEAIKILQKLTLKPSCQNRPAQAPQGKAFQTYPSAIGQIVPQHQPITIFISSGPAQAPLPNVVGQTSGDAKRALRDAGFKVAVTQQVECNDPNKDNIVQSENPNGPTAPRGSVISITVAKFRPNDPSCGSPPPST